MVRCLEHYAGILLGGVAFVARCFICGSMATAIATWGSAFGQSCSYDLVVPSRARPCCRDGELARPAWCNLRAKCGVGTIFAFFILTLGLRSRNGFLLIDGTVDASSF